MNKKGFTLVELLAILVILAVIAIITVPRITRMIDDSKKDAVNVSALGYLDAIEKYYMENSRFGADENFELDGEYSIENGVLINDDDESHTINITGDAPSEGSIFVDRGQVVSGCMTINKYKVTITNGSPSQIEKGRCSTYSGAGFIANLEGHVEADGYKYLDSPVLVYYNPVTGKKCNDYVEANSNYGVKTGCMKWYVYSIKDNNVNMFLDHNIGDSAWCTQADFDNSSVLGAKLGVSNMGGGNWGNYGNHQKGPLTLLNNLKENTKDWSTKVKGDYKEYTATISTASFHIDYSDYKARLLTAQEVAYFEKIDSFSEETTTSSSYISEFFMKGIRNSNWEAYLLVTPSKYSSQQNWGVYNDSWRNELFVNFSIITSAGVRPIISESTSLLNAVIND